MIFPQAVREYVTQLEINKHRQLLAITGDPFWVVQEANKLLNAIAGNHCVLSKNKTLTNAVWPEHNHQILGQEYQVALYDFYSGLIPDKLAALTGTIKAGGLLILLMPDLNNISTFKDPAFEIFQSSGIKDNPATHFNARFASQLNALSYIRLDQNIGWKIPEIQVTARIEQDIYTEQKHAIDLICKTAKGRANRPLLITADRGRGKSTALGFAAFELLRQHKNIIITSPQRRSVENAFHHLAALTQKNYTTGNNIHENLCFVAPDRLLLEKPQTDIIFIDEAAALPVPILKSILKHYPRVVLTTTIHGYEGTGRGFTLRFIPFLKHNYKNWQSLELKQPIRYEVSDPLEQNINQLLCLNADCALSIANDNQVKIKKISQQTLSQNELLLNQIFGLLVLSHYQTTVNDLRHLLDGNKLNIYVAIVNENHQDKVIAAALVAIEGQLENDLISAILAGKRRPKGHLLAQSLAIEEDSADCLSKAIARVIRIAVHPLVQRQAHGQTLLKYIEQDLADKVVAIGASFGGYPQLLNFWQTQNYHLLKLGFKQDKISGEHACLVAKKLDPSFNRIEKIKMRFDTQLPIQLLTCFNNLPTELCQQIIKYTLANTQIHPFDLNDAQRFINGSIGYEQAQASLWRLIWHSPHNLNACSNLSQQLIIEKIIQNKAQTVLTNNSKKQHNDKLKIAIKEFITKS